jgi:hypothetical protein
LARMISSEYLNPLVNFFESISLVRIHTLRGFQLSPGDSRPHAECWKSHS